MKPSPTFDATVSLTRFGEPDALVEQTLESLAVQQDVRLQILLLDQSDAETSLDMACSRLSSSRIQFEYKKIPAHSLSRARNTAIALTCTDLLLFIDPDAICAPDWAAVLIESLQREKIGVAGGRILPIWGKTPGWLAQSTVVRDQYSILDLGEGTADVDRVVGASFGINVARLGRDMRFDENLGRRDGRLFGGEETDFCRRCRTMGKTVLYNGGAIVKHQIPVERMSFRWLARRMYYAGIGRCMAGGKPSPSRPLNAWDYLALPFILPSYVLGYWRASRALRQRAANSL